MSLKLVTGETLEVTPVEKVEYPTFTCPFCKKTNPADWVTLTNLHVVARDKTIKEVPAKIAECCSTMYLEEEP